MTAAFLAFGLATSLGAGEPSQLRAGSPAPLFETLDQYGHPFRLADRKGAWTVLYFYPKDGTPGCTKQACAFRDALKPIHDLGAQVFGVSRGDVKSHARFTRKHSLSFPLLADPEGRVVDLYGAKGMLGWAKRWTFIIGPDLVIRDVERDVDPAADAQRVAAKLKELQKAR